MTAFFKTVSETVTVADSLLLARPYAYVTNSVRTSVSTLLRLRRKPVRYVTFDLPPHFAYLEPGDTVWTSHERIPEAPSGTGRYDTWRLIPLYIVEVNDPLSPAKITVKCVDLREVYCSWWSPLLTDIGMTDDLNGIAILDRAGGWETTRDQVGYGLRPPGDDAYQEVLANNPIVDTFGLLCEGGDDVNHLLNSTFSEGTGDTFTSWTKTTTGAAIGVNWNLYTLIDATGFRRAIQLATYATTEQAYMSQTVNSLENKLLHVKVYYKDGGAIDRMGLRISRSDTGQYWRDSDGTWQGSTQTISLTPGSGVIETLRFVSKQMDTTAGGAVNITVAVGHFSAAFNDAQISQIQGVELIEAPISTGYYGYRSPLPTKAAAVTRVRNITGIVNDSAVRVVSPTRGFAKFTVTPHWSHSDLNDAGSKYLWAADFDNLTGSEYLRAYYYRVDSGTAEWRFENGDVEYATLTVTGADLVVRDDDYEVIIRWTSESDDEHGLVGQALDIWVDGVRGITKEGQTTQVAASQCNVYLGVTPTLNESLTLDGHISRLTMDDRCPAEEELLRI